MFIDHSFGDSGLVSWAAVWGFRHTRDRRVLAYARETSFV